MYFEKASCGGDGLVVVAVVVVPRWFVPVVVDSKVVSGVAVGLSRCGG